jgi:lysophospholipase L1-like esterase
MNRGRLLHAAGWPAFLLGIATAVFAVAHFRTFFLIGDVAHTRGDFVGNLVVLLAGVLLRRFEPRLWSRWFEADESVLRRRWAVDFLPALVPFLLRGIWPLAAVVWPYALLVALGLHAVSIWAAAPTKTRSIIVSGILFVVVWGALLFMTREQPTFFLAALILLSGGLLFLRADVREWLRTESAAARPALLPLVLALFPTTSKWWLSTAAVAAGVGRLWAYPRWLRRPGYGWLMISAFAALGLLTEGALRVSPDAAAFETRHFSSNVVTNDILFWVHKDVFRGDSDFGVMRVKIRGRDVVGAKQPGVQRILCCGGSSTFGINLPPEQAWPYLADQQLRREGCPADLLNAGEPGYTIFQIKLLLEHYLLPDYHPDGVILYIGYNDSRLTRGPYSERELWRMWQATRRGEGTWQTHLSELLQHSRTYNLLAHTVVGFRHQLSTAKKPISSPPEFSATLAEMLSMLRAQKIKVLVAAEAYQEPDTIYRRIMQKQAAAYGADFLDVYDDIRKHYDAALVHTDVVHLTAEGNRDVAAIIAGAIRKEGRLCRP